MGWPGNGKSAEYDGFRGIIINAVGKGEIGGGGESGVCVVCSPGGGDGPGGTSGGPSAGGGFRSCGGTVGIGGGGDGERLCSENTSEARAPSPKDEVEDRRLW